MRHLKNIIIIISMIFMVVIINGFNKKSDSKNLKVDSSINTNKIVIACGTDASGMLMSYILKNKITNIELSNFDYTELMDCCVENQRGKQENNTENKQKIACCLLFTEYKSQ